MILKPHEIVAPAEQGAKDAPVEELRRACAPMRGLGVHVVNIRAQSKRLELKVGGEVEGRGDQ